MKKLFISLMSILLVISLVACSQTKETEHYGVIQKGVITALAKDVVSNVVDEVNKTDESSLTVDSSEDIESNEVEEVESAVVETKPADNAKPTEKPAETTKPAENKPAESNKPADNAKPSHTHDWQPVYKTVHHDAEYKEETVVTGYKVGHTYMTFDNGHKIYPCEYGYNNASINQAIRDYQKYCMDNNIESAYSEGPLCYHTFTVNEYNNINYEFDTVQKLTETKRTKVKDAWDEQVISHYACSCGATK